MSSLSESKYNYVSTF